MVEHIGKRLRELRKKRGLSQGDIADGTGMHKAYISRVENGHTVPSLAGIERLAAALGVPLHGVFREARPAKGKTRSAIADDPFLSRLSVYARRMKAGDRRVFLSLATRLSERKPAR
jgi:transcriptional regulator with XRE-family HTH domain